MLSAFNTVTTLNTKYFTCKLVSHPLLGFIITVPVFHTKLITYSLVISDNPTLNKSSTKIIGKKYRNVDLLVT